jgi:cytosine/adenosine deaminase-related metal-dependent hydrolase
MSLLIDGATIITVDPGRRVLNPGAIYIEGNRIQDVGTSDELRARHRFAERVVDGRRKIVIPGFISTHTHVGYTVFRGRAEDTGGGNITRLYLPMAAVMQRDERLAIGSLTYAELLRSGVTTVLEMEEDADVYAPFVERLGVRSAMGLMIHDADIESVRRGRYRFDAAQGTTQLHQALDFADRWHGAANGRITVMLTPNMVITSSAVQLRALREAADRRGLRLSIHLGWGPAEVAATTGLYGKRPVRHLADEGFLREDLVAAHCHHLDEEDLELIARARTAVAHCPLMNAVRGQIAPVQELQRRGVTVGLGIDNMFGDFFDVLRSCVLVARIREHDGATMPAGDALELATLGGARALGLENQVGSIEVGKRADLVMLDCRRFGLTPTLEPMPTVVYHGHGRDVEMVLVDGSVVVENGRIVGLDEGVLTDAAQAAALTAWNRFIAKYGSTIAE